MVDISVPDLGHENRIYLVYSTFHNDSATTCM